MKHTPLAKLASLFLCVLLATALALGTLGCASKPAESTSDSTAPSTEASTPSENVLQDGATLGTGAVSFTFTVVGGAGKELSATVNTDKKTVGEALTELGLISGEMGDYGLMVTTVNGETWTYKESKKYWAFYIDGAYAMTGVDATDVTPGATYTFKVESAE